MADPMRDAHVAECAAMLLREAGGDVDLAVGRADWHARNVADVRPLRPTDFWVQVRERIRSGASNGQ